MTRRAGPVIWLQTLAVLLVYAAAVWGAYRAWLSEIDSLVLALVVAFTIVQTAAIVALLGGLLLAKAVVSARERRLAAIQPVVRDRIVDWLTEEDPAARERARADVRTFARRVPRAVERCAIDLLVSISGSELDRLATLLEEIGIADRWRKGYRTRDAERRRVVVSQLARLPDGRGNGVLRAGLEDPEPSVRIEAARGLLQSDGVEDVERVFRLAVGESLLVRAVLVEDLRPHAVRLSEHALPRALSSAGTGEAVVALEMIEAWQKNLSVPGIAPLLNHPRPEVRARALRALPYASGSVDVERETCAALEDDDPEVRSAAARVAGRFGLVSAAPALERLLHAHDRGVAVAAAYALAEMGDLGADRLEAAVRANHSTGAAVALEALERVKTDRLRMARV